MAVPKVVLHATWSCFECDAHGEGPTSNREAEKHTAATKHGTQTRQTPEKR